MKNIEKSLDKRVIAIPESRQLDVLANMLEQRGAIVIRCPLVAILDTPNQTAVSEWLRRFVGQPGDELILLTGEGLRRLYAVAERIGVKKAFVESLDRVNKLARGPKPGQALKEIGLKPDIFAASPTTDGVIETLNTLDIKGHRIGVQLYGEDPNIKLMDYLNSRKAVADPVAPYIYAPESDDQKVTDLIESLYAGKVDAIAFTSQAQCKRIFSVARKAGKLAQLEEGLKKSIVAAVGPIIADELRAVNVRVDLMPEDTFFMKPMVNKLADYINSNK